MTPPLPDPHVALVDLDARPPKARDHLRVARVVALVRPEVENSHARLAHDVLDHALGALPLADPLLVLRRDELGDQPERDELDAHHHQQHAQREERPRADPFPPEPEHREVVRTMKPTAPMSRPIPPKR